MANQEHLELLQQGVNAWNTWRQQHADAKPDLHEADVSNILQLHFQPEQQ